jgi:hypothetical protein
MWRLTVALPVATIAATAILSGCGSASSRTPSLSQLPLVPGAQVVEHQVACDSGTSAYCALELVVVDQRYKTSTDLVDSQHRLLLSRKWSGATADVNGEKAADSPGHALRVTYATAFNDLTLADEDYITREKAIQLALSHTQFARQSAMSVMLEIGSG